MANLGGILLATPAEGFGGDTVSVSLQPGGPASFVHPGARHEVFFVPVVQFRSGSVGGIAHRAVHSVRNALELAVTVPPVGNALPGVAIPPDEYVIVVASGADRAHTSNTFRAKTGVAASPSGSAAGFAPPGLLGGTSPAAPGATPIAFAALGVSAFSLRSIAMAGGSVTGDYDVVLATKEHFASLVLKIPGVNAVGVGWRSPSGGGSGRPVVQVFVTKKLPAASILAGQGIPPRLPAHDRSGSPVPGVFAETDVRAGGPYSLHANLGRRRPLVPGFSTGLSRNQVFGAGTIGAALADAGAAGIAPPGPATIPPQALSATDLFNRGVPLFFLTASHVVTAVNPAGEDVLQPAFQDNGNPRTDVVGRPDRWTRFPQANYGGVDVIWADAAAVRIVDTAILASIQDIGLPSGELVLGPAELAAGITLQKSGRSTSRTQGRLVSLGTTVRVSLFIGDIEYREQAIVQAQGGTPVSEQGDSGALVLDDQRRAAGLLVGGFDKGGGVSEMIVTPIRLALGDLNYEFPGATLSAGTPNREFVLITRD